ncbi:non-specific lipid-transfer protein 1-like [Olea europaea var. sylvestris]|uniref:non-specific lipid-transfer protein 1-like n=1 Tax=Olea europaea var. sylvestris TaxID=158386 RepID=UPI000C1D1F0D|nr:non-specific lipid-transfer protein 1-like [Olea europaea var. sylvestris]
MASSTPVAVLLISFFTIHLLLAPSTSAITCSDVIKDLKPCLNYLKSGSGSPPSDCCAGASSLVSSATSTADKQAACACLKTAAKSISFKPELAKSLPGKCGISLPYPISPSVDCSKVT